MARTSRKTTDIPVQTTHEQIWNTCIYSRLSHEDEKGKERDSIGNQIAMLEHYTSERPYLKLVSVFKDINQTGTNFERPGFNAMMEAVKSGKINCIVVKDLSRFGRNYIETGTYLEKILPFFNVRFISVNDGFDSLNPNNQDESYVIPLKNLIHDIYARDISQKIKSGRVVMREKGEFTGGIAAYGYLKAEGKRLVIDEEAALVVKDIFKWAKEGMGNTTIAQRLNALKIPSPCQYRYIKGIVKSERYANTQFWYQSAVSKILRNPVYLGHMVQGKQKNDLWGNGRYVNMPREQWVEIKNTHEPLVDEETFLAIRQIKKDREYKAERAPQTENILKGYVFCGDCKRSMKRRKMPKTDGSNFYYFTCSTYEDISKNHCRKKRIDEPELLSILYKAIYTQIDLAADMEILAKKFIEKESFRQHQRGIEAEISETEKKLFRLSMFRSSLYEDYQEKLLDEGDYLFTKTKYEKDAEVLKRRLDELLMEKQRLENVLTPKNPWFGALRKWKKNKTITRAMIVELIDRVEIYSNQSVSICFQMRDEFEALQSFLEGKEKEVRYE